MKVIYEVALLILIFKISLKIILFRTGLHLRKQDRDIPKTSSIPQEHYAVEGSRNGRHYSIRDSEEGYIQDLNIH